jgi:hypothetical protein
MTCMEAWLIVYALGCVTLGLFVVYLERKVS